MKRVDLTPEQLDDVIRHRQGGLSWLGIQNATGISRRVAQRAYEQWEKARSIRELENVRVKVGEIEFERHLDTLTRWAESLVDHLLLPVYPVFTSDAETYFEMLMERDTAELSGEAIQVAMEDRSRERRIRQNRLLFESLKEHTTDTTQWSLLAGWMEGWNTCFRLYPEVVDGVAETVQITLDRIPGFDELFTTPQGQKKPSETLRQGIEDVLWRGIAQGDIGAATGLVQTENVEVMDVELLHIIIGDRSLLQNGNREMDPSLVDLCWRIINELWGRDDTKAIRDAVDRMQGVVEELETALEPLVLRPHILRTRCRLCPA